MVFKGGENKLPANENKEETITNLPNCHILKPIWQLFVNSMVFALW
jgi:hypothetical protein